jgi:hypothetical protein
MMADSTLAAIQKKMRKLASVPSVQQLSDAEVNEYINTYVLYDFPSELRLFALKETFTFYTAPNIDTYATTTAPITDPLYNFRNKYVSIHPPIYIGGLRATYTQSLDALYNTYSKINYKAQIGSGSALGTRTFTGTLGNHPFLQNNVIFNSVDTSGNPLTLIDYPISSLSGALGPAGQPQTLPSPYGDVNYVTGAYSINFNNLGANFPLPPAPNQPIWSQVVPYSPALPVMMCYYDDTFILRPVPDGVYSVQMEVYARPTELLTAGQSPKLEQWWQLIAIGAAIKACEDKVEMERVALLKPMYEDQKDMALNVTVVQNSNKRAGSIYAEQVAAGVGSGKPNVFNN